MPTGLETPVSVVIPNWNGATLLKLYLPALLNELKRYNGDTECVVVDDGSTDGSLELLRESFASVSVVSRKENSGFSSAVNDGIRAARYEHILVLNNDVEVTPGFLNELVTVFRQTPDAFSVASLQEQTSPLGVQLDGFNVVRWQSGHLEPINLTKAVLNGDSGKLGYCSAACSLFSRTKLLQIGGFCEILNPFYGEDTEVGLQALRRNWQLAFARTAIVHHQPSTTTRRKPMLVRLAPVRNFFILHWLLLDSGELWMSHLTHVLLRSVIYTLTGRIRYLIGLLWAMLMIPQIARQRQIRETGVLKSLAEILGT